jgi:hypothetical protein
MTSGMVRFFSAEELPNAVKEVILAVEYFLF